MNVMSGGDYRLTVTNSCGEYIHEIHVDGHDCDIYVPNTFTPNADGMNDYFKPIPGSDLIQIQSMQIFNRWGSLVFQSNGPPFRWDGSFKNKAVKTGTYVYLIKYSTGDNPNKTKTMKGSVGIVR